LAATRTENAANAGVTWITQTHTNNNI